MENNQRRVASIIIPTYNRGNILRQTLGRIKKQIEGTDIEVLVIDDGSNRKNVKMIKRFKYPFLKVYYQKNNGPAKARNFALKKVNGDVLIFLNDDSFISKGYIKRHLKFHKKYPNVFESLTGNTSNHPLTVNSNAMKWLVGQSGMHFNYHFKDRKFGRIPWYYFWTCNFSLKREFVVKNKLTFCEDFPTAAWEDIEFAYRAKKCGLKIYYMRDARVWHYHELSIIDIKSRFISHGRGLYYLKNKLPDNFLPFLIKSKIGRIILSIFKNEFFTLPLSLMEFVVVKTNSFPNLLMQILVIKWKADGYKIEEKTMPSM